MRKNSIKHSRSVDYISKDGSQSGSAHRCHACDATLLHLGELCSVE